MELCATADSRKLPCPAKFDTLHRKVPRMLSLLLPVIYLAFISLGLPDSLLGSAWPEMYQLMGMPISAAGIVTMIISACTIISSLLSDRLNRRLGTGVVVTVSVALTVVGMFGFSFAGTFPVLCAFAVPYGLGAGAIDAALNNYVALHYSSRQMSWLHCFWGVGTIISPYIMSHAISSGKGLSMGYRTVGFIQLGVLAVLLLALPLWKKVSAESKSIQENGNNETGSTGGKSFGVAHALKIRGIIFMLIGFLAFEAIEATVMLWASSFLFQTRGITEEKAAAFGSLFFIGITAGRFLSGFVSDRIGDRNMIRIGLAVVTVGIGVIALPIGGTVLPVIGFVLLGLGCAPVYPSIIHSTPFHFGKENSQSVIGIQMAFAYIGTTFSVSSPPMCRSVFSPRFFCSFSFYLPSCWNA